MFACGQVTVAREFDNLMEGQQPSVSMTGLDRGEMRPTDFPSGGEEKTGDIKVKSVNRY